MKTCFIVGTLARGGAERQLIFMLRALQNRGIEPRLLCLTKGEALEPEIRELGIDIEWVGSARNRLLRLGRIVTSIRKRPADIIQSSHFYTNIYAAAAGRILDIPNIGAIRNDLFSEIDANRFFGQSQLKWPAHLIVNSKLAEDRAVANGVLRNRLTYIRNVVESANGCRSHSELNGSGVNLLFAGRLVKQKRPELFIEIAHKLLLKHPDKHLVFRVAGDGELRSKIEKLIAEHRFAEDQFQLMGNQSDMAPHYGWADVLIVTSEHEGTPNVVLEAMSHGVPVVATAVGGIPEILTKSRGFLSDPSDIEGMVEAASSLVTSRHLRLELGEEGRKYVRENHSAEYLQKKLPVLYNELTER